MKEITIKIEGKEWEEAKEKAYKKATKNVKIDGFRQGKVPKDVFLKKYTEERIWLDAADELLQDAYAKLLDENKDLELVASPEVELKNLSGEGVEYNFKLTLKPSVKLNKYKNLGVKKEEVEVTEEEIENTIKEMQNRYAENVTKEGTLENGNIAIIDFEGFKDGVPFKGGKGENYSLTIGSNTFIPGFEEQLIGMKTGEEKEIKVTFPLEYHSEELKGQDATFKVKVNEIKEVVIPEINEDFFEDLGMEGIDSLDKLKEQVKENIHTHKEAHVLDHFLDELLDKCIENMEVELPDVMIEEEVNRLLKEYEEHLKMQGLSLEQFYKFTSSDEAALKDQLREEAIKRVKSRLVLEEIVKLENISTTEEEVEKEAESLTKKYNMEKSEFLPLFGGLEMVKYDLEMRKALDVLKDNN